MPDRSYPSATSLLNQLSPAQRRVVELGMEEWREIGWCPYCGERDVASHRRRNHPEMWRGGESVYGTVWHGWSDR